VASDARARWRGGGSNLGTGVREGSPEAAARTAACWPKMLDGGMPKGWPKMLDGGRPEGRGGAGR
jgi:hypothetical protein